MQHIVIVGGSLAGLSAAESLRSSSFEGRITVISDEYRMPYDRPPLSKEVLAGDWQPYRSELRSGEQYEALDVRWLLGDRAESLDAATRILSLRSGRELEYDGLVIATGARVRTLPDTDSMGGVHVLRTFDDCLGLRAALDAGPNRVAVIGAGFIGAEVAATCRKRGHEVTLIEALPQPLGRVLGPDMGEVMADIHRAHGVDLRLGVGVERLEAADRGVESVLLADGTQIEASVVVVGIGVIPNTEWLDGSGLEVDNGVVCDETCLAAPRIVAAGDVARWPNRLFGETMRVEHWDNAIDQGTHAAKTLLADMAGGKGEPFAPVPYFWSDQYDKKIQFAGRGGPDDTRAIAYGSVDEGRFCALYGREGRLVGVLGVNRMPKVMRLRRQIADGVSFDEAVAAGREG